MSSSPMLYIYKEHNLGVLQRWAVLPVAPPTPATLPNFLENRAIPCAFRRTGGIGRQSAILFVYMLTLLTPHRSLALAGRTLP
jgi:hypothetical protein